MFQSKAFDVPEKVISLDDKIKLWLELLHWCNIEDERYANGKSRFYIHADWGEPKSFIITQQDQDTIGMKQCYGYPLKWYREIVNAVREDLPFDAIFWDKLAYTACMCRILSSWSQVQIPEEGHAWIQEQYDKYHGELPPLEVIDKKGCAFIPRVRRVVRYV